MHKFIQIGNKGIAIERITKVLFEKGRVVIYFGTDYTTLTGEDHDLFLYWWENEADLHYPQLPTDTSPQVTLAVACPGCLHGERVGPDHLESCDCYVPF